MAEVEIGNIVDFFARPVVAGINLTGSLANGDEIHILGNTTDIRMVVESIQIDNASVPSAEAGQAVGVKVSERVRRGDTVYRVTSD